MKNFLAAHGISGLKTGEHGRSNVRNMKVVLYKSHAQPFQFMLACYNFSDCHSMTEEQQMLAAKVGKYICSAPKPQSLSLSAETLYE